jgi:SAM-dependent methyltransferase
MANWQTEIEPPALAQINRIGEKNWEHFLKAGSGIADVLYAQIKAHFDLSAVSPKTLDFGCGVGRVFLPMHFEHKLDVTGCDIDPDAVRYLRKAAEPCPVVRSNFKPPLQFEDGTFDCVYSVSIWTHLTPEDGSLWLSEMKRVLKPGGLALITTSGYRALVSRRKRGDPGWQDTRDEDLAANGVLYTEYEGYRTDPQRYPGVTNSYGLTAHDHDYVQREWSKVMPVKGVHLAVIAGVQDLVVMVKE